jgi:hypothetical protein
MNDSLARLEALLAEPGLAGCGTLTVRTNASGLSTAWLVLANHDLWPTFAARLSAIGGRLATTTVYRPRPDEEPGTHEVAFHMVLSGLPVTVKVTVREGQALRSVARLFPNADWEEREMMELANVAFADQPNPRRLFIDESIEAGVLDRLVPYSEFTNATDHAAIWARIRAESRRGLHRADDATPATASGGNAR